MTFSGSSVADGNILAVSLQVQNPQPAAVSASFDIHFYLALTSAFSPSSDTSLGTVTHSTGVPAGSAVTVAASLTIPESLNLNQAVYVYAGVDSGEEVAESNESNNRSSAANAAAVLVYNDEDPGRTYPLVLQTYSPSGASTADTQMTLYRDDTTIAHLHYEGPTPWAGAGYAQIDMSAAPLAPGTYYSAVMSWPDDGPYAMIVKTSGIDAVAFADLASNDDDIYEDDGDPATYPLTPQQAHPERACDAESRHRRQPVFGQSDRLRLVQVHPAVKDKCRMRNDRESSIRPMVHTEVIT